MVKGLSFSEKWVNLGGNALICDVNKESLEEKVRLVNDLKGGKSIGFLCDVRDYSMVCSAMDAAVKEFGSIDIAVNFAGGTATRMCGDRDGMELSDDK